MNQSHIFLTGLLALAAFSFPDAPQTLTGRWQQKDPNGARMQVYFRAGSSFVIIPNGKYVIGGKYDVNQDTLRSSNPACNLTYYSTDKLDFFAQDTVRLTLVQDACAGRCKAYDKATIGRVQTERLDSSN